MNKLFLLLLLFLGVSSYTFAQRIPVVSRLDSLYVRDVKVTPMNATAHNGELTFGVADTAFTTHKFIVFCSTLDSTVINANDRVPIPTYTAFLGCTLDSIAFYSAGNISLTDSLKYGTDNSAAGTLIVAQTITTANTIVKIANTTAIPNGNEVWHDFIITTVPNKFVVIGFGHLTSP